MFLDTIRTIFDGDKEIFKGLSIYDNGYEFVKHPIIRISFNSGDFSSKESFHKRIFEILKFNQHELEIVCDEKVTSSGCFEELIYQAYKKYNKKVVILIDEYDKPILDNIEDTEVARVMRDELKNFYSVIKGADEFLKFVFITGVSKFSKVSLFSGLNNIEDITLKRKYATICGYTQNDVETVFAKHLEGQDFKKIQKWYNGYKFLGEGVYNPFDILLFISNEFEYRNYWFFDSYHLSILNLMIKDNYYFPMLENNNYLTNIKFELNTLDYKQLLDEAGFLSIKNNQAIKLFFFHLFSKLININDLSRLYFATKDSLYNLELNIFEDSIKKFFNSLNKIYEYEECYVNVFYAYIKALGFDIVGEDVTNKGRIDLTIKMPNSIIIIEFKVDGNEALSQIKEKKYHEKYLDKKKPIYIVGIEFDTKERNISLLEFEEVLYN